MALHAITALPGAPENIRDAIEAAHAALDKTRCQGWMAATGHTADPYQILTPGDGPVRVFKTKKPRPWFGCEFHPVDES